MGKEMNNDVRVYHESLSPLDQEICSILFHEISNCMPDAENKVWHRHPVWFIANNPIVGYSRLKDSVRLLFWSGQSFDEPALAREGTFKAAEARYSAPDQIDTNDLRRWLEKSKVIQWDYKNIVKRKGVLERLS